MDCVYTCVYLKKKVANRNEKDIGRGDTWYTCKRTRINDDDSH